MALPQQVERYRLILPGTGEAQSIPVVRIGENLIFEGDVDVGELANPKQIARGYVTGKIDGRSIGDSAPSQATVTGPTRLWPGGVVPWRFEGNVSEPMRSTVLSAIADYSRTNLHFEQISALPNRPYIEFVETLSVPGGGHGYTNGIGRPSFAKRIITLRSGASDSPASLGTVAHAIGHAIGLYHTHTRHDRDTYIAINGRNIRDSPRAFERRERRAMAVGPYDCRSIMHHSPTHSGGDPPHDVVIEPRSPASCPNGIGQGQTLTLSDVAAINHLYPDLSCRDGPTFWRDRNQGGRVIVLTASASRLSDLEMNDAISSLCVPVAWTIRLFRRENFKGTSTTVVGGPRADLQGVEALGEDNWDDRISSIEVSGPAANKLPPECSTTPVLFQFDGFRGRLVVIRSDSENLDTNPGGSLNDLVSSVCVPPNVTIELFTWKNWLGDSLTVVGAETGLSIPNLRVLRMGDRYWNDVFSSARVN